MKKMITTLCLSLFLVAGLFAQVAAADVEKAYTILEASSDEPCAPRAALPIVVSAEQTASTTH